MKFLYSPVLSDRYETNINVILSHLIFGQLKEKSYSHYSMIFEQHLGPYNWIKIGYKYLPKYFIRYYGDRDFIGENRYSCNFFSEEIYISYSFPIRGLSWIRLKTYGRKNNYLPKQETIQRRARDREITELRIMLKLPGDLARKFGLSRNRILKIIKKGLDRRFPCGPS